MKLLVFAHTPPPHHGQSYAVEVMLKSFGGDCRRGPPALAGRSGIDCYHVNARFSKTLQDIGEFRGGKMALTLFYCVQAIWCRFRHGVEVFYYVPAPGKRVAIYRDWLIMFFCRPFFKKVILHWHAAGMAKWLETDTNISVRALTYRLFRPVDLSIVLSGYNLADAEKLLSRRICIVSGGIADPCSEFSEKLLPLRRERSAMLRALAARPAEAGEAVTMVNVLFVALVSRAKGAFDAVEGVALANQQSAASHSPLRFRLTLMGGFASEEEEASLREFVSRRGLQTTVEIAGFVPAERKRRAFEEADVFCFPTYYSAENQPANLIEAMAFGLPIITTRWRSIPEMLPPDYPGLVDIKSPAQIAEALLRLPASELAAPLRELFLRRFTLEKHLANLAAAIRSVEPE